MRQALKDKLAGVLDDSRPSSATQSENSRDGKRPVTDRVVGFVREKGEQLVSTVQEHATAITDTTGALAKQRVLQSLFSSGIVQSEHVRQALQIGIGYFLEQAQRRGGGGGSDAYNQRQKFPAGGSSTTPSHPIPDFDIEASGLETFSALMNMFGINAEVLRAHICGGELKEIVNPSSSGSLLYLTSDSTYLIKTLRDYDAKLIQQKFLQAYYQYVQQTPGTFLAKLFGVYGYIPYISKQRGITVDSFTLRFAIFSNIIPPNLDIHEKYDLKGSSYKRDANLTERLKTSATYKDNDFRAINPDGLKIPARIYEHLKRTLTNDAEFLRRLNIMDYSVLLIVHNLDNPVKPKRIGSMEALMGCIPDRMLVCMDELRTQNAASGQSGQKKERLRLRTQNETLGFAYEEIPAFNDTRAKELGGIPAVNGKGERLLLFIGIIDILQTFDICKSMQRQYQTMENRDVVDERSIVDADFYARRFNEFLFSSVFVPDDNAMPAAPAPSRNSLYPDMQIFNLGHT